MLKSTVAPCSALIRVYEENRFPSAKEALDSTLKNLGIEAESGSLDFHGNDGAVALVSGTFLGSEITGYAASAVVPENRKMIITMTWADIKDQETAMPFMASVIDALYIDTLSYFSPGIFTSFVFPRAEKNEGINIEIDGTKIKTSVDINDEEAAEYVIEREYAVLLFYKDSPLWQLAWQRYYRMIFRDSCTRLQKASFDICNALAPSCSDETELAQKLLNWTQGFEYARKTNGADFTSLPAVLKGKGCDCDSRSLLIAVILQSMNIDSVIFVSARHSHAVAGLFSTHPGFGFTLGEKTYLTGDTTVKGLTWGKISADHADPADWIPVILP